MILDPDPWTVCLAGLKSGGSEITIRQYAHSHNSRDRSGIADLIRRRFNERYLDPALDNPGRHGFTILAICCLMVEALEAFRNGWRDTKGRSEGAFCSFFQAHQEFSDLRPMAHEFYSSVRSGILHQAETTGNWRVHRGPSLFAEKNGVRWISASAFGNGLRAVLDRYHDDLAKSDWAAVVWVNARKKLQAICRNCGLPESDVARLA